MANEYYVVGNDKSLAPAYTQDQVYGKEEAYSKNEIEAKLETLNQAIGNKAGLDAITALSSSLNDKLGKNDFNNAIKDYVPKTTTVNDMPLSGPINLIYSNVGAAPAIHDHDTRYYLREDINSKIDTINSKIDTKADAGSLFTVTSEHSMTWEEDSSYDNGGYYKIIVPDCPLGKIQICDFTHYENFDREEDIDFYLPSTNHKYYVISTRVTTNNGYYKSTFEGVYANGGTKIGWADFVQNPGHGTDAHHITVVYARVS